MRLGRHAYVVGELERLVKAHPARERFAGQLMVALYRCGRQADALAVFERTRTELDEQLGLEPGSELRGLQADILNHALAVPDASPAPQRADARDHASVPAPPTPTVGREQELSALQALVPIRTCGS